MTIVQHITIHEVRRKRRTIAISYTKGESKFSFEERDAPLPEFNQAFDALAPLVSIICHFPEEYSTVNCRVIGIRMDEQGGAFNVALIVRKGIDDAAKEFAFVTPARLLAHPTEPGSYTPPLTQAQAELVNAAVEAAKQYVLGNRAQGEIAFGDPEDEAAKNNPEPGEGEALPGMSEPAPKKRGRKKGGESA